ncbi:LOW QUALITY PROTEIN: taste receptor type 2 member 42 [Microtus oregoni]|uniref:LOW QUALITY PROTEIN: taste receptor type 2 member 42 n=1 Tax=Microtus oregoni TaxID=111838 RepID=UPI001BB1AAC3|nr:LOW QUALITY PROTEIN: taste receptor type 2 member 42 [Microtus oregoni]
MFMTLMTAEFITGMLGNVFIGLVNCYDWVKIHKVTFINFILICLAVSRMSSLLVVFVDAIIWELAPHVYDSSSLAKCFDILWIMTDQLSIWFATCLSIFYFLKIAHFSHPLFLWLKWRMRSMIVVFLAFSLFLMIFYFLLLGTLPIFMEIYMMAKSNQTLFSDTHETIAVKNLIVFHLTYLIPFLVSLVSLLLLFLSLAKHSRNCHLISTSSEDSRTKVHKKAMKMLLSFLILFIIHIFFVQLTRWLFMYCPMTSSVNLVMLTLGIFPLSHSYILILGNSKLWQTAVRALHHLKSQLQEMILSLHRFSKVFTK